VDAGRTLWRIRAAHTAIWFVFAISILALPVVVIADQLRTGLGLTLFIGIEVGALALNKWRCPLRDLAGRYTRDRADGFDIFLPGWLGAKTRRIFTPILVFGVVLLAWRWFAG